jgi:hypothetical protein
MALLVLSLGKERGKNRWREFWLFQKYLVQLVPQVDGVWGIHRENFFS